MLCSSVTWEDHWSLHVHLGVWTYRRAERRRGVVQTDGSALLGANKTCGSSAAEGESARGALSPNVVAQSLWRLAVVLAAPARRVVGSCVTTRLAWAGDREEAEVWWQRCPRLLLGGEAWWRGRLGALNLAGVMRAPPGPLTKSSIMS